MQGGASAAEAASGDSDDVNTASDSTEGAPGDRWTVVGKGPVSSPAAAAAAQEPDTIAVPAEAPAALTGAGSTAAMGPDAASQAAEVAASAVLEAAAVSPTVAEAGAAGAAAGGTAESAEESDDDLADVEVGEDAGGSEVDEDWGAWD